MILPGSKERLLELAMDLTEQCRRSAGMRATYCRSLDGFRYTGSNDGNSAIYNYLNHHIDRVAGFLFSPTNLRFHIDFDHIYPKEIQNQIEVASRTLTRTFMRRDLDMIFGEGVDAALEYGACINKMLWADTGPMSTLVMPWQFGVLREDIADLSRQEVLVETNKITMHDFWRRVSHIPNGRELFKRGVHAARAANTGAEEDGPYLHQVLLTAGVNANPTAVMGPGGIMQMASDPTMMNLTPEMTENLITFHELWVIDDERQDYTTIQWAEPDILIAPMMKRRNMFVPQMHPYTLIQPNKHRGYIWGRSEIADLLKLQLLLRDRTRDEAKLMSMQYDRLLGIVGDSGMNDEKYDQFRQAGWMSLENGADIKDLTPQLPKEAFADLEKITNFMDEVAGFSNVLSGEGEPGVRAGNHAQTLMRTASPRMRDRALLVERQCADVGDKTFELLAAKDAKAYWGPEGQEFLLSQIPEDREVQVDSHSSSPIYEDDHMQSAAFLSKAGAIDGEDLIEAMPINRKDYLKDKFREKKAAEAKMMKEHPELMAQMMHGKKGGGSHHG